MKHCLIIVLAIFFINGLAFSQTTPTQTRPATPSPQRSGAAFDIAEYGVEFQADPRLIVVMAALEAAGLIHYRVADNLLRFAVWSGRI